PRQRKKCREHIAVFQRLDGQPRDLLGHDGNLPHSCFGIESCPAGEPPGGGADYAVVFVRASGTLRSVRGFPRMLVALRAARREEPALHASTTSLTACPACAWMVVSRSSWKWGRQSMY